MRAHLENIVLSQHTRRRVKFAQNCRIFCDKAKLPDVTRTMTAIVQYVVVRSDLLDELKWPTGAVIAQACHASTAALHLFRDDENTKAYTENLDNMHKVVLACPTEEELRAIHSKLTSASISHKLWMEQPENIPTAIATKPYPKTEISSFFRHLKLYK